jgi:putative acetyltransferase
VQHGDISIRPERQDDGDAIDDVVGAAFMAEFGSTSEVQLVRTMRDRGELVVSLVAELDRRIVGHIALSEVTLDGEHAGGLGLAPVAVAPEVQGMGIGGRLIDAALDIAARDGWRFVVLLGHAAYYPRFGFVPAAPLGLIGDYGDHDGWMVRPLGVHPLPAGHVRYCSSFTA